MAVNSRQKLFQTVLGIHERGAATLTASEQSIIESETKALLSAASGKVAMTAPEGFDKLIADLANSENPDDAYQMVVSFMESTGDLDKKPMDDKKDSMPMDLGKEDKGMKPEMDKKDDMPMDLPKEDKGMDLGKEDKGMDNKECPKDGPKGDGPKGDGTKNPEMDKKDLFEKADKLDKGAGKDTDEDLEDLKKEKDKGDDKKDAPSEKDMGIKSSIASKYRVRLTAERNLMVTYDSKPIFLKTVAAATKKDAKALKRLANQVLAWTIYEGEAAAAKKCGTKLIQAGADDDIELVVDETVPAASEPVVEDGSDVMADPVETPDSDVRDGADTDAQGEHVKVEAGVDDDIELVVGEGGDSAPAKVLDGAEDVVEEKPEEPDTDTQDDADVDFQSVEANFKALYTNRTHKAVKAANKAFVDKFIRAMNVAATRMLLNHSEHPYKAATYDVLTDGEIVEGMDEADAADLSEMIAEEGHADFIASLLESTAALMKKSDEYLKDMEEDLGTQNIKPVEVEARSAAKKSAKSKKLSKAASAGNFALNIGTPVTRSEHKPKTGGIRSVVGNTKLSQRVEKLDALKGQR